MPKQQKKSPRRVGQLVKQAALQKCIVCSYATTYKFSNFYQGVKIIEYVEFTCARETCGHKFSSRV